MVDLYRSTRRELKCKSKLNLTVHSSPPERPDSRSGGYTSTRVNIYAVPIREDTRQSIFQVRRDEESRTNAC